MTSVLVGPVKLSLCLKFENRWTKQMPGLTWSIYNNGPPEGKSPILQIFEWLGLQCQNSVETSQNLLMWHFIYYAGHYIWLDCIFFCIENWGEGEGGEGHASRVKLGIFRIFYMLNLLSAFCFLFRKHEGWCLTVLHYIKNIFLFLLGV